MGVGPIVPAGAAMILGFTGTRHGMSAAQRSRVRQLLIELKPDAVHHGDCLGADAQFHDIAVNFDIAITIWPSNDPRWRANRRTGRLTVWVARPPLERNENIVIAAVDGLIATPEQAEEQRHGGTWFTVRYARHLGRRIWLVLPDGMVQP